MFHGSVFTLALVNAMMRDKKKKTTKKKLRAGKKRTEQEIMDEQNAIARGDKKRHVKNNQHITTARFTMNVTRGRRFGSLLPCIYAHDQIYF